MVMIRIFPPGWNTVTWLGYPSHLTHVLWSLCCFHMTTCEGSESWAINRDGKKKKKAEAERETDYVWLLMSDPITFISWWWWTHTDYWRQWNSNLNILQFSSERLSVCQVRMCVRVRLHSLLLLFLVTNAPDCFVFFGIALMWSHTHTQTTHNLKHKTHAQPPSN